MVLRPTLAALFVVDGGLDALECVHRRRSEKLGHSNHIHVVQGPSKNFRFGNGDTKYSESYVLLMQALGDHTIALGVYTLAARNVPILIGIKTLAKLGAVLDTQLGAMALKAVDSDLIVPLRRSTTGHLLIDLCSNWLDGGSKIVESQKKMRGSSPSAFMVHEIEKKVFHEGQEVTSSHESDRSHAHVVDGLVEQSTSSFFFLPFISFGRFFSLHFAWQW